MTVLLNTGGLGDMKSTLGLLPKKAMMEGAEEKALEHSKGRRELNGLLVNLSIGAQKVPQFTRQYKEDCQQKLNVVANSQSLGAIPLSCQT